MEGAAAPAQRPTRPGVDRAGMCKCVFLGTAFSEGFSPRGGPPRSQSPCTEGSHSELVSSPDSGPVCELLRRHVDCCVPGTRRARTPSSLSPSQSPHGRRHGSCLVRLKKLFLHVSPNTDQSNKRSSAAAAWSFIPQSKPAKPAASAKSLPARWCQPCQSANVVELAGCCSLLVRFL